MTSTTAHNARSREQPFFGWHVATAAFVMAVVGWGVGFYGPPVFLHAVQEARGWSISLVSAAVTVHFLFGATIVANLANLHRRFGVPTVARAGAIMMAVGFFGWAMAREPWQLFAAAMLSGSGWAGTSTAAINAIVSPWFVRRRPAALSFAYNGASVGGVLMAPLWVALIGWLGFPGAAVLMGVVTVTVIWLLAVRYFTASPAQMGQAPDGDRAGAQAAAVHTGEPMLPGRALFRNFRFVTLAGASSLGLFAQIGLIAHLFSLLVPAFGATGAGAATGLATGCAIAGRSLLGWLLPPRADRRLLAAANYLMQVFGSLALLAAGGANVPLLIAGIVLFGAGIGNAASIPPLIAQVEFSPTDTARVVALVTAFSQGSYAFAPVVFGTVRDLLPPAAGAPEGAAPALFIAAAIAQLIAAAILVVGRQRPARAGQRL
jgi:MFS family permease